MPKELTMHAMHDPIFETFVVTEFLNWQSRDLRTKKLPVLVGPTGMENAIKPFIKNILLNKYTTGGGNH